MPARPAVPDLAVAAIRNYCENKIPVHHRHELRIEFDVRGESVTIFECRPPWHPEDGPAWTRQPVAQLRYRPEDHHWQLHYADRNSRWHRYTRSQPTLRVADLLDELDNDPTGIFWG